MATIKKISPGVVELRHKYRDKFTHKYKYINRHYKTKGEAEAAWLHIKEEIGFGFDESKNNKLVPFIRHWLNLKKTHIAKNSYRTYKGRIENHIAPYFKNIDITDINFSVYQKFINKIIQTKSKQTAESVHAVMGECMRYAVKIHKIKENPCTGVSIYSAKDRAELTNQLSKRRRLKYLPSDKIGHFLRVCYEDKYIYYIFFKFLIETGCRKGEAMALQWSDVDLDKRTVSIRKTIDYTPEDINDPFGPTKTVASERDIWLTESFAQEMKKHKEYQDNHKSFIANYKSKLDLVFCKEDGEPLPTTTLFNAYKRILKKAGLPSDLRIHSLRHTHAVLLLESNIQMKEIQERLGHKSMATTADTYSHSSKNIQQVAMERFDHQTKDFLDKNF